MSLRKMIFMLTGASGTGMEYGNVTRICFNRIIMMTQVIMRRVFYQSWWCNEHKRI